MEPANTRDRRIGRFRVSGVFDRGAMHGEGGNLFHQMIVLRAAHDLITDSVQYFAWHPDFDALPAGSSPPEYRAVFTRGQIYPTWVRT